MVGKHGSHGFWESTVPVKWSDGPGTYFCEAINRFGRIKSAMIVAVGSKPSGESSHSTILVVVSSSFGIVILVTCILTGYYKHR